LTENKRRILSRDQNPHIMRPMDFRGVTARNRIMLSPMCQYSATDGVPDDWHLVHLGSRAVGGAGIVFTEATHIEPRGRITPWCLGLWNDEQAEAFARIVRFVENQGAVPGIQLGHAGRKAGTAQPWKGGASLSPEEGGWETVGPSALPFAEGYAPPREMTLQDIAEVTRAMAASAALARKAGFRIIEIHAAHGYLLHEFLSPLSNRRTDGYGGSFDNRIRLLRESIAAVRSEWPDELPLFVRLSVSDWVEGGWDVEDSVKLASVLKADGHVDLIDCSSGGNDPRQKIAIHPGYQLPLSQAIRSGAGIATGAVGLLHGADLCEQALANGQADLIILGRALMAEPYWPLRAAKELGAAATWPVQYERSNIYY
jgi:2,4-dienoyl-CoA reductase-like NADH-dependent reductase (Old Yellow Enzyme family)